MYETRYEICDDFYMQLGLDLMGVDFSRFSCGYKYDLTIIGKEDT